MSKHSSEILKVNLKIQQSPKEKWGSLLKSQIPSVFAPPIGKGQKEATLGMKRLSPSRFLLQQGARKTVQIAAARSGWRCTALSSSSINHTRGGQLWGHQLSQGDYCCYFNKNFTNSDSKLPLWGNSSSPVGSSLQCFCRLSLFFRAVSPASVCLSLTCHTHSHHNRQDGNGIRNVCHKTNQTSKKQLAFTLNLYKSILQNNKLANGSFEPSLKGLTAFIVSLCVAFIDRLNCQLLQLLFSVFCLPRSNIVYFVVIIMCKLLHSLLFLMEKLGEISTL